MLPYRYIKNNRAKHYRITLKADHIRVTIPRYGSKRRAEVFTESKKEWIESVIKKSVQRKIYSTEEIETLRAQAKNYIPERVTKLAETHGFVFNDIRIKKIRTRWGSCSRRKNLNFSLYLMLVDHTYIDYVILHELSHTVEMNHGPKFWALLESVCPGSKKLDREMRDFSNMF